jgi:hypothetical protein
MALNRVAQRIFLFIGRRIIDEPTEAIALLSQCREILGHKVRHRVPFVATGA